jgi:hypothetical protein
MKAFVFTVVLSSLAVTGMAVAFIYQARIEDSKTMHWSRFTGMASDGLSLRPDGTYTLNLGSDLPPITSIRGTWKEDRTSITLFPRDKARKMTRLLKRTSGACEALVDERRTGGLSPPFAFVKDPECERRFEQVGN